jgi:dynein heavy chain
MLRILLDDSDDIPWDALIYIIGNINYGGRVTDDFDRTCLLALLRKCYNIEILEEDFIYS